MHGRSIGFAAVLLGLAACSGGEDETADSTASPSPSAPESAEPADSSDLASLTGDASAGEAISRRCLSCHSIEPGQNRHGPSLFGVVDRDIGSAAGYGYSAANQQFDGAWTPENLFAYLESPRDFMPGTTMVFAGLPDPQDRADLIAYLETLR